MTDEVDGGAEWIAELPRLAAACIEQWSLDAGQPIDAAHSLVIPAGETILKLNPPEEESEHEAEALARWNGQGAARLLARDDSRRALLVERLRPGMQLWSLPDEEATEIAAGVLEQLWIPAADPFRRLEDAAAQWIDFLPAHWEAIGRTYERRLLDEALDFLREAGPTQRESVLMHQDLHGGNVLLSERGWLAIDPKPMVGEREFDVASLIRDRRPTSRRAMLRRLDYLVDRLALNRERTRGWGLAHALAWGNGSIVMVDAARFLSASKAL
jgi:streptomycin 6-kinase